MKKNVASQVIGAQMCSATDGSAFTGSVTVYVTGDGGTQAVGSVASGACTHEGNGFHTYVPAQAETNYDHVAFTFIGTGAIPATVQAFPTFPQTGDNYARLGTPVGASVSADVAAAKSDTGAIKTKTDFLPSATAGATGGLFIAGTNAATTITTALTANITGNLSGSVDSVTGAVGSVTGLTNTTIADQVWDEVLSGHLTAGTTGAGLNAAGSAGDPWSTALPGAYGAGSAGYIMGTNLDAAVTSRMATYTQPTGFLAATFPTTVASTTNITAATGITVATNSDKTGYSLTATTGLGNQTADITGSLSGSVGSVTGAVGSVTGHTPQTGDTYALANGASGFVATKADTAAILVDTAEIGAAGAGLTAIATAANLALVAADTAAILVDTGTTLPASLASIEARGDNVVCTGTVSATSPTTTSFTPSALSPSGSVADQFKGRIIIFDKATTTAALRGQATDITANTAAALPVFTVTALTTAPASGDTFSIV